MKNPFENSFFAKPKWFIFFSIQLVVLCQLAVAQDGKLTLTEFSELKEAKEKIGKKEPVHLEEYQKLIIRADKALKEGSYSVMHKKRIPPSGSKHDYLSLAPYFWPNPNTSDKLPYIRKDGEVNPETRDDYTDYDEMKRFFNAVDVLGKAFFYSGNKAYALKASNLMACWFLDPETLMNPNLKFGQGVPGVNDGRPFGIIEFGGIRDAITCMELLKIGGGLNAETEMKFKAWLAEYSDWLKNSELGTMERNTTNNHGNWYDLQLCSILLYIGKTEAVKEMLESAKLNRIAKQIEPDGSQPKELERTKAFSYSAMNLNALTQLAYLGKRNGVDLWNFETPDGRGIKKAYGYLIPFITSDKKWEYQQLGNIEEVKASLVGQLAWAGKTFNDQTFISVARQYKAMKTNK